MNKPEQGKPIEAGILPLCVALNSVGGIKTRYSCEGHSRSGMAPYVSFSADEARARQLAIVISKSNLLKYCWRVAGSFNDEGIWLYHLESNDRRLGKSPSLMRTFFPPWRRKVMDRELVTLASIITHELS
ncbi:hypothetical protein ACWQ7L_19295 [Enterobacter cloacae]